MKNITLSADERLIEDARKLARSRHTTLNAEFRKWLEDYADREHLVQRYREILKELSYVDLGGREFTREQLHERRR